MIKQHDNESVFRDLAFKENTYFIKNNVVSLKLHCSKDLYIKTRGREFMRRFKYLRFKLFKPFLSLCLYVFCQCWTTIVDKMAGVYSYSYIGGLTALTGPAPLCIPSDTLVIRGGLIPPPANTINK